MNPKQITPQSLYVELDRSCLLVGLLLVSSWFFAAFSYLLSSKTGTDWFSRTGSVMCLVGAAATFRLAGFLQQKLTIALKQGLLSVQREIELILDPPHRYHLVLYCGYATGIVGTVIWGYGDMLPRLLAK
ncbi:hypothetical protein [Tunturibacter empetritectus]|uniref:Uncharacterized protein n=1 Tax=Tunturiibacter lichenicola TaxID=2051959 RepID=A0A7W8J5W3_9BACT|nr:hypothetical protein [Edaphobacter lichenicola]MBB5343238.1 hypothetical protein [Edaphobacter lichenicola]